MSDMGGAGRPGFGEVLRGHRRAARLTLEQLAEVSGVSARTLSDMERGRSKGPQARTVTALADALKLDGTARTRLIELARDGRLRDHWTRQGGLCELPRSVEDFTGRAAELIWMSELVYVESSPGVGVVGLVTGSAGLGKTTFAVRAAHAVRPSFPDGVLFLDLFGMSQRPLAADDALRMLLRALGVADRHVPGDPQERASLYRSLLREKRVLVVLDNAASEEQVRPLLPGGGASRALITTRRLPAGLEGVRRLVLGPLPSAESTELLTGILGERSANDEASTLTRLADLCGGLPLALRIIGNRLLSRPDWDAAQLAARLADEERRLEQFKAGDLKIANAFGMSYEQLADSARRVFRSLAVIPGRDFDAALTAVAGGVPIADAWDALDELVDLGLLQDSTAGRYRFHDLVRLFARDRLQAEETAAGRQASTERVTSWLLRMATMSGRWFEPGYGRPDRPDPDLAVQSSGEEADWWLRGNVDYWLGAMRMAVGDRPSLVLDCAEAMHWFSERWVHGPHWHEVFTLGAEAAAALGDLTQQAAQLNYLSWVHSVPPREPQLMLRYATEALEVATKAGATAQVAWAGEYTAGALRLLGRWDEALAMSLRAAETFRTIGDMDSHVQCLAHVANCLRDEGRHGKALEYYVSLLALMDDEHSGMTPSVVAHSRPYALIRIAQCLGHLGRRAEAIAGLGEGLELLEALQVSDYRHGEALETLAALLAEEGRTDESRGAYARAALVFESIGDTEAGSRCHALAGAATAVS
ncbi:helix-turn-helix domain-containing protein [Streptomyces sp. P9(2023)]|uniref:helix-turn-helix domain-containing protein n=1 Tax=Streptomyces sp. P9(2023) TaxID=3064394 RepID=UPI0028F3E69B|nr:helix-turn-helix domain-containing protein [Streptomyces sp. P9(2023)]MDT9687313.1 helix-turn-helix domain-containing protein [Streptomyces sp. P9(2023)]